MARLKPCMKCPSDRVAFDRDVDADGFGRYLFVKCLDCGVRSRPKFVVEEEPQDYQEVADDWNDRPLERQQSEPLPAVWIRPGDLNRSMIAVQGERAEVAPLREGEFTEPLYSQPLKTTDQEGSQ